MISKYFYSSPIGLIELKVEGGFLTELTFNDDADSVSNENLILPEDFNVIEKTNRWLEVYFSGNEPDFTPKIKMQATPFQLSIWNEILKIPYAKTVSYGEIAKALCLGKKYSPRAVGTALSKNKISLIIPCHRVVGKNEELKGYAWGINRKKFLLELEKSK